MNFLRRNALIIYCCIANYSKNLQLKTKQNKFIISPSFCSGSEIVMKCSQDVGQGCSHLKYDWGWGSYFHDGSLTWLLAGSLRFPVMAPPFSPTSRPLKHTPMGYLSVLTTWHLASHRADIPRGQSRNCEAF